MGVEGYVAQQRPPRGRPLLRPVGCHRRRPGPAARAARRCRRRGAARAPQRRREPGGPPGDGEQLAPRGGGRCEVGCFSGFRGAGGGRDRRGLRGGGHGWRGDASPRQFSERAERKQARRVTGAGVVTGGLVAAARSTRTWRAAARAAQARLRRRVKRALARALHRAAAVRSPLPRAAWARASSASPRSWLRRCRLSSSMAWSSSSAAAVSRPAPRRARPRSSMEMARKPSAPRRRSESAAVSNVCASAEGTSPPARRSSRGCAHLAASRSRPWAPRGRGTGAGRRGRAGPGRR